MKQIVHAAATKRLNIQPAIVVSNNPDAPALAFAQEQGIPAFCLNAGRSGGTKAADEAIARALVEHQVQLVILSGYMKRIGPVTLATYPQHILNIHPSLLPAFGGTGMYGLRVHTAVIEAGVKESGATVHVVDELYDHGRILAQRHVPVLPGDTPEQLQARVGAEEGRLYIEVLEQLLAGQLSLTAPSSSQA